MADWAGGGHPIVLLTSSVKFYYLPRYNVVCIIPYLQNCMNFSQVSLYSRFRSVWTLKKGIMTVPRCTDRSISFHHVQDWFIYVHGLSILLQGHPSPIRNFYSKPLSCTLPSSSSCPEAILASDSANSNLDGLKGHSKKAFTSFLHISGVSMRTERFFGSNLPPRLGSASSGT